MKTNYHTHTTRCHHATGSDEEFVLSAIKGGYQEIGFSDHTPWKYHTNYISDIRMLPEELPGYVESLRSLQENVTAVAAFPYFHLALLEHFLSFNVAQESTITLFVTFLDSCYKAEFLCQFLTRLNVARVHPEHRPDERNIGQKTQHGHPLHLPAADRADQEQHKRCAQQALVQPVRAIAPGHKPT